MNKSSPRNRRVRYGGAEMAAEFALLCPEKVVSIEFHSEDERHAYDAYQRVLLRGTPTRGRSMSRPRGAGRPAARPADRRNTGASRDGPDDDSGEPEPPRRWQPARSADHLLRDVSDYLARLRGWGAERGWLVDQISFLGYPAERVGVALALAVSNGQARGGLVRTTPT